MSAFVGYVRLDGSEASDAVAATMLERLRHRVDVAGWNARWTDARGAVALGSAPLNATPQAQWECAGGAAALSLPSADGGEWLRLVGDVRLDGREALAFELGLDTTKARAWSDGRLALEAYSLWREEAPFHLKGDFAFAVWDEKNQTLFCARDRFGVRPFYFAFVPGVVFAFANEIKALWPALPFPPCPDEVQIGAYLAGEITSFTRTFYEGVERLAPARTLSLALDAHPSASPRQGQYFSLDASRELELPHDDDYAQRVKAAFERSVAERSRSAGELATFLSGGLDSSSVAAVAIRQAPPDKVPLLALSTVFARFAECDERPWIEQNLALAGDKLRREWVWGDDIGALHDIERVVWHLDGPPLGPNTCSTWVQYPPLQEAGVKVVLDGHGGDEVVFLGYERVAELAFQRRFGAARHELRALRRAGITNQSIWPLWWGPLMQRARGTRFLGRFLRLFSRGIEAMPFPRARSGSASEDEESAALVRELVRADKRALLPAISSPPASPIVRAHHAEMLGTAMQAVALEAIDSQAGAHALEVRVPFWEQEMVELCLSLPSDQKLRDGWNRWVMRRAMQGLLPPGVQWRAAKTNFAPQMIHGLRAVEAARIETWLEEPGALAEWLDVAAVHRLWEELKILPPSGGHVTRVAFALWRVLALGAWLQGVEKGSSGNMAFTQTEQVRGI